MESVTDRPSAGEAPRPSCLPKRDAHRHWRVVTHMRENHTNPAQATEEAVRGFEFDGELLILTVEPARQLRVVWRKLR